MKEAHLKAFLLEGILMEIKDSNGREMFWKEIRGLFVANFRRLAMCISF